MLESQYLCVECRTSNPDRFRGSLSRVTYPEFETIGISADAHSVRTTANTLTDDRRNFFSALVVFSGGPVVIEQRDRRVSVGASEFTFWNEAKPYDLTAASAVRLVLVRTPSDQAPRLLAPQRMLDECELRRLTVGPGVTGLTYDFINRFVELSDNQGIALGLSWQLPHVLSASIQSASRPPNLTGEATALRSRVLNYIAANVTDPRLGVDAICQEVNISRRGLYRLFPDEHGVATVIRKMRIEHAARLLATTSLPIERIAASVGYSTSRQFYRTFQAVAGMAPGEYRRSIKRVQPRTSRPE